jgi:excisionase family DNA binding protein
MGIETNQMVAAATNSVPVEEFINKVEVARRLKKQVRTVDNWMKRGILPYYKIGRSVAFKWSEIEAALARTCRVCRC